MTQTDQHNSLSPAAIEDAYFDDTEPVTHDYVPKYFPDRDREAIQGLVEHNIEFLDEHGADTMLWPSQEPDSIGQTYFGISEETPMRLQGIGPCLGVVLMNEDTGRTLAAHLEARTEGIHDLDREAEYSAQMLWSLFADKPSRIELVSSLGGEPYHEKVKHQLQSIYQRQIPPYIMSARVDIDPSKSSIETTELWELIAQQKAEKR